SAVSANTSGAILAPASGEAKSVCNRPPGLSLPFGFWARADAPEELPNPTSARSRPIEPRTKPSRMRGVEKPCRRRRLFFIRIFSVYVSADNKFVTFLIVADGRIE